MANKAGTPPNTSLVLSENELEYINQQFNGSKSAAIHAALGAMMNSMQIENLTRYGRKGWQWDAAFLANSRKSYRTNEAGEGLWEYVTKTDEWVQIKGTSQYILVGAKDDVQNALEQSKQLG